jgi:predicted ester cyclase
MSEVDLVAEGELVAIHFTYAGVRCGELMGVPPTGKPVSFSATAIHRVVDGKITDDWINFDTLGILRQISDGPSPS